MILDRGGFCWTWGFLNVRGLYVRSYDGGYAKCSKGKVEMSKRENSDGVRRLRNRVVNHGTKETL